MKNGVVGKNEIEEAALAIVREKGYGGLNARALASALGCSTMPIFSRYGDMYGLKKALAVRITEIYTGYIDRGLAEDNGFRGVGRAYRKFAAEEKELFKLFFMTPKGEKTEFPAGDPNYGKVTDAAVVATGLSRENAERLYQEMWIFVHGLAVMSATGAQVYDDEKAEQMVSECFLALKRKMQEDENG